MFNLLYTCIKAHITVTAVFFCFSSCFIGTEPVIIIASLHQIFVLIACSGSVCNYFVISVITFSHRDLCSGSSGTFAECNRIIFTIKCHFYIVWSCKKPDIALETFEYSLYIVFLPTFLYARNFIVNIGIFFIYFVQIRNVFRRSDFFIGSIIGIGSIYLIAVCSCHFFPEQINLCISGCRYR